MVEEKWKQLYLNNNKKKRKEETLVLVRMCEVILDETEEGNHGVVDDRLVDL